MTIPFTNYIKTAATTAGIAASTLSGGDVFAQQAGPSLPPRQGHYSLHAPVVPRSGTNIDGRAVEGGAIVLANKPLTIIQNERGYPDYNTTATVEIERLGRLLGVELPSPDNSRSQSEVLKILADAVEVLRYGQISEPVFYSQHPRLNEASRIAKALGLSPVKTEIPIFDANGVVMTTDSRTSTESFYVAELLNQASNSLRIQNQDWTPVNKRDAEIMDAIPNLVVPNNGAETFMSPTQVKPYNPPVLPKFNSGDSVPVDGNEDSDVVPEDLKSSETPEGEIETPEVEILPAPVQPKKIAIGEGGTSVN